MTVLRFSEVAALLRVSDDTVRRWVDQGRLTAVQPDGGRMAISAAEVAQFVKERRDQDDGTGLMHSSARNRLDGIVTDVQRDGLVALVEIQAGPFRVVSMMTREAADELGLEPGSLATAVIKSTTVLVETPPTDRA
ncbi:MAG: excisionase family DNA-binding protein [Cryobacterium sp.]